jgi:hypothetical protein
MTRSVYFFGNGSADGTRDMKTILGGKGANLAEMTNLGVPVPPGFTIAAHRCVSYLADGVIDDAFREAGIEIAFPQHDLHVRSVDPGVASFLAARGGPDSPAP